MFKHALIGAAALAAVLASAPAYAGGSFQTLPVIGGSSYCASTVTGTGNLGGQTGQGQGTVGSICAQTVPAGPSTFAGTEVAPVDIYAPGTQNGNPQQTALVPLTSLGSGSYLAPATPATATMPNGVGFYYVIATTGTAVAITAEPNPIEGSEFEIACESATTAAVTYVANSGQTVIGSPAADCAIGTVWKWRYNAAAATWYRI